MKDIDMIARELADRVHVAMIQTMQGNGDITAARNIGGAIISKALAAYGDEMAKHMRDTALCAYNTHWNCEPIKINDAIRALPLPSEVTK